MNDRCEFFKPDPSKHATCVNIDWHHNGSYRCQHEGDQDLCDYHKRLNTDCAYEDKSATCHNTGSIRHKLPCERMHCSLYADISEIDEAYDDTYAVCPFCKTKYGDCFEWVTENDELMVCDVCGKKFTVRAEYSTTYYSTPKI